MDSARRAAGLTGAVTLAAAAMLHGAWAAGSPWPATHQDELADLVVGKRPMPGPVACAVVAGTLGVASAATAAAVLESPTRPGTSPARRLARVTAAGMLARGTAGLVAGALDLGTATPTFRRWDRRVYSPLCVGLAASVWLGLRPARDHR